MPLIVRPTPDLFLTLHMLAFLLNDEDPAGLRHDCLKAGDLARQLEDALVTLEKRAMPYATNGSPTEGVLLIARKGIDSLRACNSTVIST
jgi:hypothetical protein